MALMLVHRLWSFAVKDVLPVFLPSTRFSTLLQWAAPLPNFLSPSRLLPGSLPRTFHRAVSFDVRDKEDFTDRVINSDLPVLIWFTATWCGPCRFLGPRLEKAVAQQKGRVVVAKVDINDHADLAMEYGASTLPTVIAMRGGHVIDQFVGGRDSVFVDSFVANLIGE